MPPPPVPGGARSFVADGARRTTDRPGLARRVKAEAPTAVEMLEPGVFWTKIVNVFNALIYSYFRKWFRTSF